MRKLVYILANGTETTSYKVATQSGYSYKVEMRPVEEEKPPVSQIRQAMLDQFGCVSASLRDKVVLN